MSTHARAEKVCPFCAETIKAAAIRCRYCHADLADPADPADGTETARGDVEDDRESAAPPVALVEDPEDEDEDAAAHAGPGLALLAALGVLCLVLGLLLGRVLWLQHDDEEQVADRMSVATESDPDARAAQADADIEGAVVASEGAKSAGLSAAAASVQKVLSYSWETLDEDMAAAQAQLAPDKREEYVSTMEEIRAGTEKNKITVVATVASASVVSATAHDVKALLFVNQETTGKHLAAPRYDQNRVLVTLHRDDGEWTVTELTAM